MAVAYVLGFLVGYRHAFCAEYQFDNIVFAAAKGIQGQHEIAQLKIRYELVQAPAKVSQLWPVVGRPDLPNPRRSYLMTQ